MSNPKPIGFASLSPEQLEEVKKKLSESMKEKYKRGELTGKAFKSEDEIARRKRISESMKLRGAGGYRKGSGRGKKGWYKGFFCDSTYELAYVIYCLDHDISIKRNTEKRSYVYQGVERNYIPDFIVNGVLVEIKGYNTDQWKAKMRDNPDVQVYYENDLKDVFSYVKSKYGKNFDQLYEERK